MNSKKKNTLTLLALLILLLFIFINNQSVKRSIITGTELWLTKVFPSLFPMFIMSELLSSYHLPEILANTLGKIFHKIFRTSTYGVFTLFMSLIAGTPSSAYILKNLTEEKKITEKEASHLLKFTFFSNPLFLITMLSLIFPSQNQLIACIILIHYFSNVIIGFLIRPSVSLPYHKIAYDKKDNNIGSILSIAIKKSLNTLLLILGTICFYLMISEILTTSSPFLNVLIKGFLELTQGLNSLLKLSTNSFIKAILSLSFISFGGLSIHTQVKSIIADTQISYLSFLKGRLLHVLISISLFLLYSACITLIA